MQYDLITIVASRRGVAALKHLLSELPSSFGSPIACMVESWPGMVEQLQAVSRLKVQLARPGMRIEKGHVYVSAPGESLMCLAEGTLGIVPCGPESSGMHPVDGFLESAARIHRARHLSLVLSGFPHDGVEGCDCVKSLGGTVLVLDRATAAHWAWPSRSSRRERWIACSPSWKSPKRCAPASPARTCCAAPRSRCSSRGCSRPRCA